MLWVVAIPGPEPDSRSDAGKMRAQLALALQPPSRIHHSGMPSREDRGQVVKPIKVELDQGTRNFYIQTLTVLNEARMPYLVGGAYAMGTLADIERHTKDIDIFVRKRDRDRTLSVLESAGYRTEVTFPHWLAKAWIVERFVDVIYSSGNGAAPVDDEWFEHAVDAELLGIPVRLCPA